MTDDQANRHLRHANRIAQAALDAGRARIKVIALVTATGFGFNAEPRYLQVTTRLPPALVADALAVQVANREYQERALAREGLQRMYIGTLSLALFLAVFGAVLLIAPGLKPTLIGLALVAPVVVRHLIAQRREVPSPA